VDKERVKAQQDKKKAINKLQTSHFAKDAAIQDAQDMAAIVLYAEQKFGEVLKERPESVRPSRGGSSNPLPPNITHKESHRAQMLANNPDIVEKVIADANEKNEIPTSWQESVRLQGDG